ncbi:DUF6059 family protein [Streptomyces sp. NPDC001904]|uniref:DUF6059 family protein n=1 Tax=Streptomyces sp. NPDC001904 TaxID=3154531 RepID=UPI00331C8A5E
MAHRRWPARLLGQAASALVALGGQYVLGEMRRAGAGRTVLARPPAGHPERLCADVPLTSLELALERQVDVHWRRRCEG